MERSERVSREAAWAPLTCVWQGRREGSTDSPLRGSHVPIVSIDPFITRVQLLRRAQRPRSVLPNKTQFM